MKYENAYSIPKTKVNARELFSSLLKERAETGRIYIMNIDHCNTHSSFKDLVRMSNLCQEITLPTDPIQHIDGEGEIALCILSAINVGKIEELELLFLPEKTFMCFVKQLCLLSLLKMGSIPMKLNASSCSILKSRI